MKPFVLLGLVFLSLGLATPSSAVWGAGMRPSPTPTAVATPTPRSSPTLTPSWAKLLGSPQGPWETQHETTPTCTPCPTPVPVQEEAVLGGTPPVKIIFGGLVVVAIILILISWSYYSGGSSAEGNIYSRIAFRFSLAANVALLLGAALMFFIWSV
ncbi:MAG: hypothetical protein AAB483_00095 [Patescibacteria group bacterium]